MKIFFDTANIENIKRWAASGLIDGVTTNPSSLSKAGGDPKKNILEICKLLPQGHISVEITDLEPNAAYKQAKEIAELAHNIWVKIPCHERYYPVIKKLVDEKININVTLVFTLIQSLMMCKLGVYYISPFVGRWEDIDVDGMECIVQMRAMIDHYNFQTKILAASIRSIRSFHKAINAGADVITLPVELFEKSLVNPLTDQGIEKFNQDWKKLGISQFP